MGTSSQWFRGFTAGLLMVSLLATASASVLEDFEGFSPNTTPGVPFTVGAAPEEATFSGNAFAGVVGQGVLYHSGIRSWMVIEDSVGRIDFDVNAAAVDFFARPHPTANGDTVIEAFDDSSTQVGSTITLTPGADWTAISFTGNIDYILVDNQATNIMNGIDDFGYSAIPEPTTIALCIFGSTMLLTTRRRR